MNATQSRLKIATTALAGSVMRLGNSATLAAEGMGLFSSLAKNYPVTKNTLSQKGKRKRNAQMRSRGMAVK